MAIQRVARRNIRAEAARLLAAVTSSGRSLDPVLASVKETDRDRALIYELVFGSVRHWFSLNDAIERRLARPLRAKDHVLRCLLVLGAYQLYHTRVPAHAAVNETVAAAVGIGRSSAKGLVNQILRSLAREPPADEQSEVSRFDHPQWLIDRVRREHPGEWAQLLQINNGRAPMALRVNARRTDRDGYQARLRLAGLDSHPGMTTAALVLTAPAPVAQLPGFQDGDVSVQDEGAQLAVDIVAPRPGDRILDACAAPGGKALACLERADVELTALEIDPARCERMRAEFIRLGFDPRCVHEADATNTDWWDGVPFDRVLLDVPCSGTGTLRRHPDIKLLRRESDLAAYHAIQSKLLTVLWQVLRAGGTLVYCTCSILDEENDQVVAAFLRRTPDASVRAISASWGFQTGCGRQLLPSEGGPDGFYYAVLEKRPE